jgi:hypothetical protein
MTTFNSGHQRKTADQIFSDFDIVAIFNLINYDENMGTLYHDLKHMLHNKFNGSPQEFGPNERIIFLHYDLDFFIHRELPGFTLYNLQLILRELDISNYFCIVVSNLPNFEKYTKLAKNLLTNDDFDLCAVSTSYFNITYSKLEKQSVSPELIEYPFTVLSRLSRFHRTYFMSQLFDRQLQDLGQISYHNIPAAADEVSKITVPELIKTPCHFLSTIPFTRNNTELKPRDAKNLDVVKKFQNSVSFYKNFEETVDVKQKLLVMRLQNNPLRTSLIYIGLETTINCVEPYLSEISFKSISVKRPFILLGVAGTLAYLKKLGFQTFDQYWDESYDQIEDFEQRVDAIIDIIHIWSRKSVVELQQIAEQMTPVLEHNFNHLCNTLPQQQLESIKQQSQRK